MKYIEVTVILKDELLHELLMAEMAEAGYESFCETDDGFKAYIPEKDFSEKALTSCFYFDPQQTSYTWTEVPDQNWNAEWEKNFQPVEVDDFCGIRAPFHAPMTGKKFEILIEPKMSFGTGHHETTSNMIRLMSGLNLEGNNVLDMGCGTAVLAILASKMGAREIVAIDNDDWAYHNSIENTERNATRDIRVLLGDASLLNSFPKGHFDVILANINRNILINDIPAYARVLKDGGTLLLSGFYTADVPLILEKCQQFSLREVRSIKLNDWVALECSK